MARRGPSLAALASMLRARAIVERYMGGRKMPEEQHLVTIMEGLVDAFSTEQVLRALGEVCDRRAASLSAEAGRRGHGSAHRAWVAVSAKVHQAAQVAANRFVVLLILLPLTATACTGNPNRDAVIWGSALQSMGTPPAQRSHIYTRTNPDGTVSTCHALPHHVTCF